MKYRLWKCEVCNQYTIHQDKCPYCGGKLKVPHPPKFSPEDPYGKYRRKLKKEILVREDKWKKH
ncbi:MAG: RNA-protein complex protein Nop10 [Euryarchaeota archaeon]|nr:RNA-protein complex protein Nop10 [Euryarchaeota archaeon]